MAYNVKKYGWKPDLPDHRDQIYAAPVTALATLPAKVDLTPQCPKTVYDQKQLGSCTANSLAAAMEFDLLKQKVADFMPSRLFIYYNERVIEHTVQEDAGGMLRDGMKTLNKLGVPHESLWPYSDANPGPFQEKPSAAAFQDALKHKATAYQRIPRNLRAMKGRLASGFPFVFGFTVYASFESKEVAQTGEVPMPGPSEETLGGHAVLAVGYDDGSQRFIVRNSWGPNWGKHGYFTLPYAYLLDEQLSSDFWTVLSVAG
jgi:C1A family cysteine protease